jgi:hypothetical protein
MLIAALVTPAPAAAWTDCAALAAERTRLEAEHKTGAAAIADVAMGRKPTKSKGPSAGQVGEVAAGTAASVLLPFPFGPLLNLGRAAARAAARNKQKQAQPAAPAPDVEAMVRRQNEIETRLAEIRAETKGAGCAPATAELPPVEANPEPTPTAEAPQPKG